MVSHTDAMSSVDLLRVPVRREVLSSPGELVLEAAVMQAVVRDGLSTGRVAGREGVAMHPLVAVADTEGNLMRPAPG